jgi:glucokinase
MSDATASPCNVFALWPRALRRVGSGVPVADEPVVLVDVSVAFHLAISLPTGDRDRRISLESGAGQLALHTHEVDESAVLDVLRRRHGQLSISQVVCADGLVDLHRAVCALRGMEPPRLGAREIVARAAIAASPECARAMSIWCGLLGDTAGRAALTAAARGGVFIGGDIVPALGDWFARSPFRRRFEACGGDAQVLRAIATCVVVGEHDRGDGAASRVGRVGVQGP